MELVEVRPGQADDGDDVQPHMVNGQRIAHGGFIFTLADSAFAFACNSHNERDGRCRRQHQLYPAGQARRPAGRDGARNLAQRTIRHL